MPNKTILAVCHPIRLHHAKGLCLNCYMKRWVKTKKRKHIKEYKASDLEKRRAYKARNFPKYLWSRAKYRASKSGLDFNIEVEDVVIPTFCPVFGIPLIPFSGRCSPNVPTIDRIDNTQGYVKGNIIVVSFRANSLKRDATLDELSKLVDFYSTLSEG